jgi:hypothetical protein
VKRFLLELFKMVQQSILQIFSQGLEQHMAPNLRDIVTEIKFLMLLQPLSMARIQIELVVFFQKYQQIHIFLFLKLLSSQGVDQIFLLWQFLKIKLLEARGRGFRIVYFNVQFRLIPPKRRNSVLLFYRIYLFTDLQNS